LCLKQSGTKTNPIRFPLKALKEILIHAIIQRLTCIKKKRTERYTYTMINGKEFFPHFCPDDDGSGHPPTDHTSVHRHSHHNKSNVPSLCQSRQIGSIEIRPSQPITPHNGPYHNK